MGISSTWLFVVACVLAVAVPVGCGVWFVLGRRARRRWQRWAQGLTVALAVVLAQLLALTGLFLGLNRQYGFYASWGELLGEVETSQEPIVDDVPEPSVTPSEIPISADNPHPNGLLETAPVPPASGTFANVTVWLPPAYFEPGHDRDQFPVLVLVGPPHANAEGTARLFKASTFHHEMISSGRATPYIAVHLPGSITPGIDAECTDLPGSPQETFVATTVPQWLASRYRVTSNHRHWFIAGYSSGGWCAAHLTFTHPEVYAAGAAIAPYFHPLYNNRRWAGDQTLVNRHSIVRKVRAGEGKGLRLLTVVSKQDQQSWGRPGVADERGPDTQIFHQVAQHLPGMAWLILDRGGHFTGTYTPHLPRVVDWFARQGL